MGVKPLTCILLVMGTPGLVGSLPSSFFPMGNHGTGDLNPYPFSPGVSVKQNLEDSWIQQPLQKETSAFLQYSLAPIPTTGQRILI